MITPIHQHSLFWFRRDLRHIDNAGLYHALHTSQKVSLVFVFDRAILDALTNKADRRIEFIYLSLKELKDALRAIGADLLIVHAVAAVAIPQLARQLKVDAVFCNEDYEPDALARDKAVASSLKENGQDFFAYKDQAIFAKDEVLTQNARPFSVFTPYKNAWLRKLQNGHNDFYSRAYPTEKYFDRLVKSGSLSSSISTSKMVLENVPDLTQLGFVPTNLTQMALPTGMSGAQKLLNNFSEQIDLYQQQRDFPWVKGVSYLSMHNRFGTISPRHLVRMALARQIESSSLGAQTWLNELIWRDFYFAVLWHYPHVVSHAFKAAYDILPWRANQAARVDFELWCAGKTGYPLVDAAMQQLLQTGFMHNRLRMVVASFLTKHLLIDWRWGADFFAQHLNDFDLSANNGGWQWAASTGCDAQPYFRIFNPIIQSQKFDAQGKFIRRYFPVLSAFSNAAIHAPWTTPAMLQADMGCVIGRDYPAPIIDHELARQRALAFFAQVKQA